MELRKYILRRLQNIGFFIQRFPITKYTEIEYIPNIKRYAQYLKKKPPSIQIHELKKIFKPLQHANNQVLYNDFLNYFIPQWNENIQAADFIRRGYGSENINTFRKIVTQDKTVLFEKVYSTHSLSLKKLFLFEHYFREQLQEQVKSPRLVRFYKGELLTIVYFEFLSQKPISQNESINKAVELARLLYDFGNLRTDSFANLPSVLFEYKNHPYYKVKKSRAKSCLEKNNIDYKKIEKKLGEGRQVLTHGDLKYGHIFPHNTLIDWDEFGIFPLGLEQAYMYYSRFIKAKSDYKKKPLKWLSQNFAPTVTKEEWKLFQTGYIYFLFIMAFDELKRPGLKPLNQVLIKEIKKV